MIRTNKNTVVANWYIKPMSSSRYKHANSNHDFGTKMNIIKAIKNRALKLSQLIFHMENRIKLISIFVENGYNTRFLERMINDLEINELQETSSVPTIVGD
ncbi:hypothetical protein WA026_003019 [Henosepilachna vigintioctopunctata]|uniref:Helix-turn-helix domain-containing protein n=1 Tax=Henosepilachna vigintioctopunctata TaxID=420089 RepID=A0AAW1TNF7_9CUCU